MTRDERIAVAMILALPDDEPWDFAPGFPTAREYFADVEHAAGHHTRRWTPPERPRRPTARRKK